MMVVRHCARHSYVHRTLAADVTGLLDADFGGSAVLPPANLTSMRHHTSLRLKACLISLLLVVAMCLFFILLGNGSLQLLLEKNRENRYYNFQFQVAGLMEQSRQEVVQLAELIALNDQGRVASREEIRSAMDRQWSLLEYSWKLQSIKVYSRAATAPLTWGAPGEHLSSKQVEQVLLHGNSLEQIHCTHICVQSLAVPVRARGGDYVLQLDRAMSHQLQKFRDMTGSDIGILSDVRREGRVAGEGSYLKSWGREVLALTSRDRLLPLLYQVSRESADLPRLEDSRIYQLNNRDYDVKTMGINASMGGAQFVFVDDVSGQVLHIRESLQLLLLFSVLGALIFSAAVAGTLWNPIVRLRRLAQALPLLTNGRFDEARRLIQPVQKNLDRFDELDVLDNTGLTMCDQLEDMNEMVGRKTAQLEQIAMHDSLTGLDNRYSLLEQLENYLSQFQRDESGNENLTGPAEQGYLFFIDLDDFKQVNDCLGHHSGDELLCIIAKRLLSVMRCGDVVARLGGDEFCVFVRHLSDADTHRALAEKMLEAVAKPVKLVGNMVEVTMSVGVVAIENQSETLESLLQKADMAMYHAKRNGKNKYQLYSPGLPTLSDVPSKKGAASATTLELISAQPR